MSDVLFNVFFFSRVAPSFVVTFHSIFIWPAEVQFLLSLFVLDTQENMRNLRLKGDILSLQQQFIETVYNVKFK